MWSPCDHHLWSPYYHHISLNFIEFHPIFKGECAFINDLLWLCMFLLFGLSQLHHNDITPGQSQQSSGSFPVAKVHRNSLWLVSVLPASVRRVVFSARCSTLPIRHELNRHQLDEAIHTRSNVAMTLLRRKVHWLEAWSFFLKCSPAEMRAYLKAEVKKSILEKLPTLLGENINSRCFEDVCSFPQCCDLQPLSTWWSQSRQAHLAGRSRLTQVGLGKRQPICHVTLRFNGPD